MLAAIPTSAKLIAGGLVALFAFSWVFLGTDNRAQVEYDFQTLTDLPAGGGLRSQAWDVYDYGTPEQKRAFGEKLRLMGFDEAASHFPPPSPPLALQPYR
jgi:hypothetical protein